MFSLLLLPQDKPPQIPRLSTFTDKLPVPQMRSPGTAWRVLRSESLPAVPMAGVLSGSSELPWGDV